MIDQQIVIERLEALSVYIAELDHYAQYTSNELTADFVKYRATQHSLLLAAQAVVDIAAHIVAADLDERVQDYRQAIQSLGQAGILPSEFAEHLAPLAGFRNILVHDYLVVDPAKVYDLLIQGRADLKAFGRHISAYLQRAGLPRKARRRGG